ncbi:MAG: transcription termination/antitermination protein NusG, partial [Candidatus Aminicenantia bacterium]
YVINTKPKKELLVEKIFEKVGIEVYNPKIPENGKVKAFSPDYIFSRFELPQNYRLIKYARGVKKIIENEDGPIPLADEIIKEIKSREVNELIAFKVLKKEPKIGDEIEIEEGPFKGFRGIFEREMDDLEQVIILLQMINYQARLLIDRNKLIKAI